MIPKSYSFPSMTKITKLSRKNRFRTVVSPGGCGVFNTPVLEQSIEVTLGHLELTLVVNTSF